MAAKADPPRHKRFRSLKDWKAEFNQTWKSDDSDEENQEKIGHKCFRSIKDWKANFHQTWKILSEDTEESLEKLVQESEEKPKNVQLLLEIAEAANDALKGEYSKALQKFANDSMTKVALFTKMDWNLDRLTPLLESVLGCVYNMIIDGSFDSSAYENPDLHFVLKVIGFNHEAAYRFMFYCDVKINNYIIMEKSPFFHYKGHTENFFPLVHVFLLYDLELERYEEALEANEVMKETLRMHRFNDDDFDEVCSFHEAFSKKKKEEPEFVFAKCAIDMYNSSDPYKKNLRGKKAIEVFKYCVKYLRLVQQYELPTQLDVALGKALFGPTKLQDFNVISPWIDLAQCGLYTTDFLLEDSNDEKDAIEKAKSHYDSEVKPTLKVLYGLYFEAATEPFKSTVYPEGLECLRVWHGDGVARIMGHELAHLKKLGKFFNTVLTCSKD